MHKRKRFIWVPAIAVTVLALAAPVACDTAYAEELQGRLVAAQGNEIAVRLEDGRVLSLKVEKKDLKTEAGALIGERVEIEARSTNKSREAIEVRSIGEDGEASGAINAISAGTWTIGGQTFMVDRLTQLDGGVREGVNARVEFVTRADGTRVAKEIETDEEDEHLSGKLESSDDDKIVVGGRTFEKTAATMVDDDLGADDKVRVEFVRRPDGTETAVRVEKDLSDDEHVSGMIEAMDADSITIGGRVFVVNSATALDSGLAKGVTARVEVVKMSDGTLVATEVETDSERERVVNKIEAISDDKVVIDGKTFVMNETTRREADLGKDDKVEVRFIELGDGTLVVASIRSARPGDDGPGDDGGQSGGSGGSTPEDQHLTGVIEAIGADTFTVNGQVFKIDRFTMVDTGLAVGKAVSLEFQVLSDGSKLLKQIETGDGVEPGDDKGGVSTPEPGDDKGGISTPEPGDDSSSGGGAGSGSGSGGGSGGGSGSGSGGGSGGGGN